jgi:hypothetical protein
MSKSEPKTWTYRGWVIEEDFESWADRAPEIFLKNRTGYFVRGTTGKYRTLAEAKRRVDEVIAEEVSDG